MDCCEFKLSAVTKTKPQPLFKLDLVEGIIVKRPSAKCKTPYVADVILKERNESILGHTPALGCCGLSDKDQQHSNPPKTIHRRYPESQHAIKRATKSIGP